MGYLVTNSCNSHPNKQLKEICSSQKETCTPSPNNPHPNKQVKEMYSSWKKTCTPSLKVVGNRVF